MMFLAPSNIEKRSMGAPFIQAQFHPASGTIQQGIMLPQEHLMPQERIPEELYYQERMMPQGSMVHQERLVPQQHVVPQDPMVMKELVPQGNMVSQSRMGSPTSMPPQARLVPQQSMEYQDRMVPQENVQKIAHTSPEHTHPPLNQEEQITKVLAEAHNDLRRSEEELLRAVKSGYEYSHRQTYPQAPSYVYSSPPPNYNTPAPSAPSYAPPASVHSDPATKFLLKTDLTELIKPVTGKTAGKLNGLLGLLSLFGSGKGLELTGIKDLLIDGILKPLLVAKGGIKALIGKLSIPIVALILINLEVLITIWWLWEDCPEVKHEVVYAKPSYPAAPSSPSYNYR